MNTAPLYIKTHNSLLHSMIKIDDLINYAKEKEIKALTITDNNMYGVMEFYKKCLKNNIKPIVGLEVEIENQKIVLYVKSYIGYKNLLKINTELDNINIETLNNLNEDIICIVPFDSINLFEKLNKIYKDIFVSYKNEIEKEKIKEKKVYMNEILYLEREDKNYLKYLHAIKKGVAFDEITTYKEDYHFEVIEEDTNQYIVENCNLIMEDNDNLLPIFPCPNNMDSFEYLKKLCKEGLRRIFGDQVLKIYIERLKYELSVINQMGFSNYFLVVQDYVDYAKKNGILVGPGRGSAAGSLVSYCLNITTVDPIKYNLLFERFLNPERISMPDIDIDFQDIRRNEVIDYCINKYGRKRVAPIITFGTMAAKQVLRDVARVMNISEIDPLVKLINPQLTLKENYTNNVGIRNYINKRNDFSILYRVATKFEGLKRHTSTHAAGIVMSKYDLDEVLPIDNKHEFYTTSYSMEYLEEIGLLKMDFLGLKTLNLIDKILKNIPVKIDFDKIPLNDDDAINIFKEVNTVGIFQFESAGMVNFLKKLRASSFEDISSALALFRPGPMANIDTYIARKYGKEKINYYHKDLEEILSSTYGIVVYQEQIIQIVNKMADYTYGEADVLRKAMSKKQESVMLKEKEIFVKRAVKNGYEEKLAIDVYDLILKFASYGFNRAHSVAYAMISYKLAYLKAKFKIEFMQALLTVDSGSETKTREYITECKRMKIKLLPISINNSINEYKKENNSLRLPFNLIKGIGTQTIDSIIKERNKREFKSLYDFIKRVNVSKKQLESLILTGCFDEFDIPRRMLMENIDAIINYGDIIKDLDEEFAPKPVLKQHQEYPRSDLLNFEQTLLGIYVTEHPLTKYRVDQEQLIYINEIDSYFDKTVQILFIIENLRITTTKSGNEMAFITAIDELGKTEVILFPTVYEGNLNRGDICIATGKVEKRFSKYQIIVNKIKTVE